MTWVPLQESGLSFQSFLQNGATLEDSIGAVVNGGPPLDATFVYVAFTDIAYQGNLNMGWSGRVRMTMLSLNAVSPGAGFSFQPCEMSQRLGGDVLVANVINDQPPYPDDEWASDNIEAFTPNEFIGDVSLNFVYDPETEIWSGPAQHFSVITATMITASFSVLFEVELDAAPPSGSFWTDLVNVRQEV
jgi:hypothetical protein